jgi:hypothetical protein
MNLDITLVPYGKISYVIPSLIRYLEESEDWTRGRASVDDIVKFIINGQMQLWAVFDPQDSTVYGYVVTEIKPYPRKTMLVVQYCAMQPNHMKYVEDKMHMTAEKFAVDMGCQGIEFFGRPGWEPHIKKHGYTKKTVVFEKHFSEVAK